MRAVVNGFDAGQFADSVSRPGIDPREWISYGIVDPETDADKSVEFDPDYGPLVNVTLHPSGKQVRARVAAQMAGNGEGEWFPFVEKDEVLVALAGGNERSCVIIGRLNQGVDGFPAKVGGVDTSKNAVAFRRCRTPYVWEVADRFMLTAKKKNSALAMDQGGNWYVRDGESNTMCISADWMGFQDKEAGNVLQLQQSKNRFFVGVDGARATLCLDPNSVSNLTSMGSIYISGAGTQAAWHATSVESIVALLVALGTKVVPPWTEPQVVAAIAAMLPLQPTTLTAIQTALKKPALQPLAPSIGCPGLFVG